jgi:hypothetical protein
MLTVSILSTYCEILCPVHFLFQLDVQLVSSFICCENLFPVHFWFQLEISKLPFLSSAQTFKCTRYSKVLHIASLLPFVVCKYYNVKVRFQEKPYMLQVCCHILFVNSIIWKIGFERNMPCFVFIFLLEKLSQKLGQWFLLVGKKNIWYQMGTEIEHLKWRIVCEYSIYVDVLSTRQSSIHLPPSTKICKGTDIRHDISSTSNSNLLSYNCQSSWKIKNAPQSTPEIISNFMAL